jgi:transcriptional activator for dhaKLM operon
MDGRPCALFILDESACVLTRCGHPDTLEALDSLGFMAGSYCAESIIGTCSLSGVNDRAAGKNSGRSTF